MHYCIQLQAGKALTHFLLPRSFFFFFFLSKAITKLFPFLVSNPNDHLQDLGFTVGSTLVLFCFGGLNVDPINQVGVSWGWGHLPLPGFISVSGSVKRNP